MVVAEFQSGSHQPHAQRLQAYYGRDAVHFHCPIWLDAAERACLEYVITADMPPEGTATHRDSGARQSDACFSCAHSPDQRDLRCGGQSCRLHMEVFAGSSRCCGILPYIAEILEAFRSHMDVQFVATSAGVSAYMSKLSKYLGKDCVLEDANNGDSWKFALGFLRQFRAAEPETHMLLQRLPTQRFNRRTKYLGVPTFSTAPQHVLLHAACLQHDFSTVTQLRAYRTDSELLETPEPYEVRKLAAVGASMASPWNPVFLEQWLLLNVALVESDRELWCSDASTLPTDLQSMLRRDLGRAYLELRPEHREELLLHGETGPNLENLVRNFAARRFLRGLLAGRLYEGVGSSPLPLAAHSLCPEQRTIFQQIMRRNWMLSLTRSSVSWSRAPWARARPICWWSLRGNARGISVAACAFSGLQATRLRDQLGDADIVVDTVHGLFGIGQPLERAAAKPYKHNLILIDEFVLLGAEIMRGTRPASCLHWLALRIGCSYSPLITMGRPWQT